ncbi:GM17116 [Drosophila sechellia]|uniref:Cilia- and flagella-associated protein 91 n=1 Tax=Drosophila sechellia TaxID=7238 RepID=B4I5C1_DROSE|nr:GM17116 [Drosophila sechellia]
MPSAKEKRLRRERILQFIRENRELMPISSTTVLKPPTVKKEDTLKQKKRVTFNHGKQRSIGESTRNKDSEQNIGQGLTSCLITRSSDTRLASGTNNPAERDVGKLPRTDSECKFNEPGIFFLQKPHSDFTTQEVKLNAKPLRKELKNKCDFFPKYVDNRPFKDEATQTLYRESSAQTLAFLPEILNNQKSESLELYTLAKLLPGDKPPGLHEVEFLERARRRWKFSKALEDNFKHLLCEARELSIKTQYKEVLEAFEWEQWIQREEDIQQCQMMRLEIVVKMFDKREKAMHNASKARIEKSVQQIEKAAGRMVCARMKLSISVECDATTFSWPKPLESGRNRVPCRLLDHRAPSSTAH